MLVGSIRLIRF
jgi:serine/threonine protein kinase